MSYEQEYEQTLVSLREKNIAAEESKRSKLPSFLLDLVAYGFLLIIFYLMVTAHTWLTWTSWHEAYENLLQIF